MKVESDLSSHVIFRSNRGGSAEFDLKKIHAWACLDLKQHLISAKTWWAWSYHDFWLGHLAISNRILRNNSLDVGTEFSKRAWRGTAVRDTSFLTMIQQSYGIVYVRSISHL